MKLNDFPTIKITSCLSIRNMLYQEIIKKCVVGDLDHANKINSNLEKEVSIIKAKCLKAGYPNGFINSMINDFHQIKEDFLISPSLFEEQKEISLQLSFVKEMKRKLNELFTS